MHRLSRLVVLSALALLAAGCKPAPVPPPTDIKTAPRPAPPTAAPAPAPMASATATIIGLSGNAVTGTVTFRQTATGVDVEASLQNLTPGLHGFHIHVMGDCSGDGTGAGDHFNPGGHPHGAPTGGMVHAGDLGNLEADATGNATMMTTSTALKLDASDAGILGRSVIVHESADDLTTQPSGNSGARIGCGVITLSGGDTAPAGDTAPGMGATAPAGMDATAPAGTTTP